MASVVDLLTGESTALADLQVRAACEAGVANLGATAHAQVTSGSQHELLGQYTDKRLFDAYESYESYESQKRKRHGSIS